VVGIAVDKTEHTVQIGKYAFRVACDERARKDVAPRRAEAIARWLLAEWRRERASAEAGRERPCPT